MHDYPEAFDADHLAELLDANSSCPTLGDEEIDRLIDLAERRAQGRGENSALEETETDCLIATDWTGFANQEFGYDNGSLNQFAIGVHNERASVGKDASLFTDVYVVQHGWLTTGDGRRSQVEQYVDEDYDAAEDGEMWIPKSAQDYLCIVALTSELVHGPPTAGDAM